MELFELCYELLLDSLTLFCIVVSTKLCKYDQCYQNTRVHCIIHSVQNSRHKLMFMFIQKVYITIFKLKLYCTALWKHISCEG